MLFGPANLCREQRMMREYEQRATIGTAKDDVKRALGYIDSSNLPARPVIDENLSVGNVYIAIAIDGNAFTAALAEGFKIAQSSVRPDQGAVGDVLGLAAYIDALAGKSRDEAMSVQIIGKTP